jgi:hypothetical protein
MIGTKYEQTTEGSSISGIDNPSPPHTTMSKQTEEQHQALNDKFREVEAAFTMARLYSNQAACRMASEERRFIASFLFGRAVASVFLCMDSGQLTSEASKELAESAEASHNDVCNVVCGAYCFTCAESTSCPCNVGSIESLDVYDSILQDLARDHNGGKDANPYTTLVESLRPAADFLVAIATVEGDYQALETANRIRALVTA